MNWGLSNAITLAKHIKRSLEEDGYNAVSQRLLKLITYMEGLEDAEEERYSIDKDYNRRSRLKVAIERMKLARDAAKGRRQFHIAADVQHVIDVAINFIYGSEESEYVEEESSRKEEEKSCREKEYKDWSHIRTESDYFSMQLFEEFWNHSSKQKEEDFQKEIRGIDECCYSGIVNVEVDRTGQEHIITRPEVFVDERCRIRYTQHGRVETTEYSPFPGSNESR